MAKKSTPIIIKTNSKTITNYELTIKKSSLIELLNKDGSVNIPEDAAVTVCVHGGGYCSNTNLYITDTPNDEGGAVIKIEYSEET